mmetsp:Transcript_2252/g.4632  ORF Transcript_2252/g.4632 Transcript_2252/m.4632 type:complete len:125 (+) Transcript_2252:210-584(+)
MSGIWGRPAPCLHEGRHALILATAGATINVHMIMQKDSRAHAAKHPNHGAMACGGKADAMGARDGMPADGGDGSVGELVFTLRRTWASVTITSSGTEQWMPAATMRCGACTSGFTMRRQTGDIH